MKVAVIGSGLASYAACNVLERKNIIPDVYDVGLSPTKKIEKFQLKLKKNLNKWSKSDIEQLNNFSNVEKNEFPRKKFFGSDFIYSYINKSNFRNNPSYSKAYGGFSNVWSASALFPNINDLKSWPKNSLPKLSIYKKYFMNIPYVSANDKIEKYFPNLKKNFSQIESDIKIDNLKKDLDKLNNTSFVTGSSRIFLETKKKDSKCRFCGYCMTGCSFESIFNAKDEFNKLLKKNKIKYYNNKKVVKFKKIGNKIRIFFDDSQQFVDYDKVLVGAGALSTSSIILNSLKKIRKVSLKHAALFVIPFLSLKSFSFNWPQTNTLSKIFIELKDIKSDNWAHCQLNQANEIVLNKLGYFRFNFFPLNLIYSFFLKRLFTLTCTLHSNYSGNYKVSSSKLNKKINIKYVKNIKSKKQINKIFSLLKKKFFNLNFFSLKYLINYAHKADNYYIGGSFPMREAPSQYNHTNILGEINGLEGVHIIDSSTFPSIPATTFGLLIMLNSARITDKIFNLKK
jgi:hypothetical protein